MIVGYARVSWNDQNLERQLENLKTLCSKNIYRTVWEIY
ncbi:recombinase family protein [Staphylococcus aureus]